MKNKVIVLNQYNDAKVTNCRLGDNVSLMCPKCYALYHVAQSGFMTAKSNIGIDLLLAPRYCIQCAKCDYEGEAVALEVPISFAVSVLNYLGYTTEMSCCGHKGDNINHAFIKFAEEYNFYFLPDNWFMEGVFLKSSLSDHEESIHCLNRWIKMLKK